MELETVTALPVLPRRAADSNKGMFGRVLIVAGSRGMSGAAVLCGSAALRGGAGLVRVATAADVQPLVATGNLCYMTLPLPHDGTGLISATALPELVAWAQKNDVVAIGPGLGRSAELDRLIAQLVENIEVPLVLDADGLNAIAENVATLGRHRGPVVITPHPGEFAQLLHSDVAAVQANRRELAANFAGEQKLVVVLKGHRTVVTDGGRIYENTTGNPGMATAGSGDVLTGVIAALVGQRLEPFAAAQLGVYLHGLAGDLAAKVLGETGLIASDLLDYLPQAVNEHHKSE